MLISGPVSNSHKNLATIITWGKPSTYVVVVYDTSRYVIHVLIDLQSDVNTQILSVLTLKLFEQLLFKVRTQCAEFVVHDSQYHCLPV
jgi:hypothetical protein